MSLKKLENGKKVKRGPPTTNKLTKRVESRATCDKKQYGITAAYKWKGETILNVHTHVQYNMKITKKV